MLLETLLRERLAGERCLRLLAAAMPAEDATMTFASLNVIERLIDYDTTDALPDYLWLQTLRDGLAQVWPHHGQLLMDTGHTSTIDFSQILLAAWNVLEEAAQNQIYLKVNATATRCHV